MYGYAYVLELKLTYFNPIFLENYIIQKKCLGNLGNNILVLFRELRLILFIFLFQVRPKMFLF